MTWLHLWLTRNRFNAARDRRQAMPKPPPPPRNIPLRPDPEYRERRLAQFSPARRERYWRNVEAINAGAV